MAKPFTSAEARQLIDEHGGLIHALTAAADAADRYRNEIIHSAKKIAARQTLELLRELPVEELNRDKLGIRTKSLRSSGYTNLADVHSATVAELEAVNGISESGAYLIKNIVQKLADEASVGVKIRLSADEKTPQSDALVQAVTRYRRAVGPAEDCRRLLSDYRECTETYCELLSPAVKSLRWFFTSGSTKEHAVDAYNALSALLGEDYGAPAKRYLNELDYVSALSADDAWEEFTSDPVRYINILEDTVPELIGGEDNIYGLPEELAQQLQDEIFFPDGLKSELRRYQEWGVKYILHQERVLLGDEMGLGKTVQAIAAMVSLKNTGATHFVVVCPASVVSNWCREIKKHSMLRVIKVHGQGRLLALRDWMYTGGVAVTTFETTGIFELPETFRFTMLTVDEAHYIKNPAAIRSINAKKLCSHADRLLFMTGTALENRVDEMVELIRILKPEIAASIRGMEALRSAPKFRELIAPVYYRRRREDVLTELPELIESKEWCGMGAKELLVYERDILEKRIAAARRVSWNVEDPAKNSSKARRLLELVDDAEADGRKVIVFSFFLDTISTVRELLGSRCLTPITGAMPPAKRQDIIDEFEKAPAGSVLAAQIQSGGTGLNIQSASVVILCEPQFKPSIENQAISRAYRMGQTRNVLVYRLLCENSIDERISELLSEKQAKFDAFADISAAAESSLEIDEKSFSGLIEEEIERIRNR